MDPGTLPEPPELAKIDPSIAKIPKTSSFLGYPILRHQFRAQIIDFQGPREILEAPGGPGGPKSILRIWVDLARSG